jgi:Flp pilus assembly protein TadD
MRWVAVALCAVAALAALVAYRSERRADEVVRLALLTARTRTSDSGTSERARHRALDLLPQARLLNPDTNLDVQEGLFLEPDRQRALTVLRDAAHDEPENVFLWLTLSKSQEREGRLPAARAAYARARALDPRLPAPR